VSDDDCAISVRGLTKSYGTFPALRGIDFEVRRGEVLALLGPNGAGKTTTVEILEGYRQRDGGTVSVLGSDPERRDRRLRAKVGIVLQECAVDPYLTVTEAMTQRAGLYPSPRPVGEVVELVGLAAKATARVKSLSGGQQRRLDLGMGLVGDPELIFLDEPTTGFDPSARRDAWDVRGLCAEGRTVVLTTHYMDEAQALADTVTVIAAGRVVASGSPDTLGGRDHGETTVRFVLPAGASIADLPLPAGVVPARRGEFVEFHIDEPTPVLHALTEWAIGRGEVLAGLAVNRPTLEDVYLSLTGGESLTGGPQAGGGGSR
jgi:ABC-2 type transport system ATP-binding protein